MKPNSAASAKGAYRLDHVQIAMPEGGEEQARSFYGDLLGLEEIAKPAILVARGGVWFRVGDRQIHLGVENDFRPARKAHVGLLVESLEEIVKACRLADLEVAEGERLEGYVRAFVHDFFGNRVELMQIASDNAEQP